jgi:hypothetical protein
MIPAVQEGPDSWAGARASASITRTVGPLGLLALSS